MSKIKIKNIRVKNSIGFANDTLFLLSVDEYEKYKNVIPECKIDWWLRTFGYSSYYASYVGSNGYAYFGGHNVNYDDTGIRPALKSENFEEVGKKYSVDTFSFTCIDKGLGIATVPISFDKFDDESNNYEKSHIRKWLLNWYNKGEIGKSGD